MALTRTLLSSAAAALVVLLAGCATTPATSAPASPTGTVDRTADVRAVAGDTVTSATETEPGRIEVDTTIADPRGGAGSAEAVAAIAVCNAVLSLGVTHVTVREADGTTFVVAGHPKYGATCVEI